MLFRFLFVFILGVIVFLVFFVTIPLLVKLFGGSFTEVIQHPMYVMFLGSVCIVSTCFVIDSTVDIKTFKLKK